MNTITALFMSIIFGMAYSQTKPLKVVVSGFKSDKGTCIINVFSDKKGFPSENKKALKIIKSKIIKGRCEINIDNLKSGTYAISVFHDENQNNKMDTNFFGIPNEGTGNSNNPIVEGGPPNFDECKFNFDYSKNLIQISVKYL